MSVALSDVKRRIGVTRQIRKVCSTLQKVAAARMGRELKHISQADLYFQRICRLLALARASLPLDAPTHPLMRSRSAGIRAVAVLGADRGLCGSFNTLLMNRLRQAIREQPLASLEVLASGRVIQRRAAKQEGLHVVTVGGLDALVDTIMEGYASGRYSSVDVIYWRYHSPANQELVSERVLPADFAAAQAGEQPPASGSLLIEPGPVEIIDKLLPEYVRSKLRISFRNSLVSENAQRQVAMSRATENAGEMLTDLTKSYRRLRQESITTEMLELIGGLGAGGR